MKSFGFNFFISVYLTQLAELILSVVFLSGGTAFRGRHSWILCRGETRVGDIGRADRGHCPEQCGDDWHHDVACCIEPHRTSPRRADALTRAAARKRWNRHDW